MDWLISAIRSKSSKWYLFWRLSRSERWLLTQALLLLPLMAFALRWFRFSRIHAALTRLTPANSPPVQGRRQYILAQAHSAARMVRVAGGRSPFRANCLHQSITLWWLLRRRGIESELRIGVRREANRLEAHAWVAYQGLALNEREDIHQRFKSFDQAIMPAKVNPV